MKGKRKKSKTTVEEIAITLENLAETIERTVAKKEDLERFATKEDLERFATKEEMNRGFAIVDQRFEQVDRRFDAVEDTLVRTREELRSILTDHETRITTLEDEIGL